MLKTINKIDHGAITRMLLTSKIKHNRNFSEKLKKARQVAEFCIKHRTQNRNLNPFSTREFVSYDYNFPVSPLH